MRGINKTNKASLVYEGGGPQGRREDGCCRTPPPPPAGGASSQAKGPWGRPSKKLHSCPIACVGATIGRPPTYRSNAFSGIVFLQGANGRGRAMLAPTRVFRQSGLGVHHSFIFRSCLRFMRSSKAAFCLSHLASYSGVAGSMQRAKLQCRPSRRLSLKRRYQCPQ